MADLYHTGLVVKDLRSSIETYGALMGTEFTPPQLRCLDLRDDAAEYHVDLTIAYSRQGPHRVELIEAVPGTLWDVREGAPTAHHLGIWCDDVPGESAKLSAAGNPLLATLAADPERATYLAYHRLPDGSLIELVDASARDRLEAWFAGAEYAGPAGRHARPSE
ncbi:VOC family protein [Pseudonocardia halophobica]|nr:VOC family protein [Pseudonocardia halophobica]